MKTELDEKIVSLHKGVNFPNMPRDEYEARIRRARELMQKHKVDALLLFAPEDLYYYTGFKKENFPIEKKWRRGAIIPLEGDPAMLMGNEVYFNAFTTSWVKDIRGWGGKAEYGRPQNFLAEFCNIIKEKRLHQKTLALELWSNMVAIEVDFSWKEFEELQSLLPDARFVDGEKLIWEQRIIKTPFEIGIIRELMETTTRAFQACMGAIQEGASERKIADGFYDFIFSDKVLWNHPTIGRFSVKGPGRYHTELMGPKATILSNGDMIAVDGGPCHKGYWSRVQRSACIGPPPARQNELNQIALEVLKRGLEEIRPGNSIAAIQTKVLEVLKKKKEQYNLTGEEFAIHGLGLHPQEPPCLENGIVKDDMIIQEGMHLSINVNIADFPDFKIVGGNIGESVLVTGMGIENMTEGIPKQ
jgi:Xaa-Pro dipeptidase